MTQGFDLSKFRSEFLQSDGWKVSDCYKPYEDKFLRKDAQDAYEGAKWGYDSRQLEIDELQKEVNKEREEATDYFIDLAFANAKCRELQNKIDKLTAINASLVAYKNKLLEELDK